jgi:hypothetical protein
MIIGGVLVLKGNQLSENILMNRNIMLEDLPLNGSKSVKTNYLIISDTIISPMLTIKSSSLNVPLKVDLKSLSGKTVTQYLFHGELFVQPKIKSTGKYSLSISNLGDEQVRISLLFGHLYEQSVDNEVKATFTLKENTIGAPLILIGGLLFISGLVYRIFLLALKGRLVSKPTKLYK